jgi:hypothetical protein
MKLDEIEQNTIRLFNVKNYPAFICLDDEMSIYIDKDKNVSIYGAKGIKVKSDDEIDISAKTVNIRAKEDVYIGSDRDITAQSKTINLNPREEDTGGYIKK